uniref:HMG box domain-containing protein n=1 Tax=Strigamia maritima TaxID=126957 RepID=T1IZV6_STRMM
MEPKGDVESVDFTADIITLMFTFPRFRAFLHCQRRPICCWATGGAEKRRRLTPSSEMKLMSESLSGISRSGRVRKQTIKYDDFEMFESCAKNDTDSGLDHDYCTVQTSKPHSDSHSVKVAKEKKVGKRKKGRPMTAYILWCRDHRPRVVAENPDLDFGGISVRLGEIWQAMPLSEKKPWKQQADILMEEYQAKIKPSRRKPQTMRSAVTKLTEFSYLVDAETISPNNDQESNSPSEVILPHLMVTEVVDDDLAAREMEIKIEQNDEFDDVDSRCHNADPSDEFEDIDSMSLKMEIEIEPNDDFDDVKSSSNDVLEKEIKIEPSDEFEDIEFETLKMEIEIEPNDVFEASRSHDVGEREINIEPYVDFVDADSMTHDVGGIVVPVEPINVYLAKLEEVETPGIVAENPDKDFSGINIPAGVDTLTPKEKKFWRRPQKLLTTNTPHSIYPAKKEKVKKQKATSDDIYIKYRLPVSASVLWCRDQRPQLEAENPGISYSERKKRSLRLWERLSRKERTPWEQQAKILKEEYLEYSAAQDEYKPYKYKYKYNPPRRQPQTTKSAVRKLTEMEVFKDSVVEGMSKSPVKMVEELSALDLLAARGSGDLPSEINVQSKSIIIEPNDEFDDTDSISHDDGEIEKKRPISGYRWWCRAYRPTIVAEYPKMKYTEIPKQLSKVWKALPNEERMWWHRCRNQMLVNSETVETTETSGENQPWKRQKNILMEEYRTKIDAFSKQLQTISAVTELTEMEGSKARVDDGMSKTIICLKSSKKTEEFSNLIDSPNNNQESNSSPKVVILPSLINTEMSDDDLAAEGRKKKIAQNDEFDDVDSRSHDAEPSDEFEDIESMNETLKIDIEIEPNDEFDDEDSSSHDVVEREINIDSSTRDDGGIPEKERVNKRRRIAARNPHMNFYEINRLVDERHQRKKMKAEKLYWSRQEKLLEKSTPHSVYLAKKKKKKRLVSAYALWRREKKPQLIAEHPGICGLEILGRLSILWRKLPHKEKMFWYQQREQMLAKVLENPETTETSEEAQPAENTETSEETQPAETSEETQPSTSKS